MLAQEQNARGERAAMPSQVTQRVPETPGPNVQIPQEGIWWSWLLLLNAVLEVAYSTADVDTGC